jgi:hypothetical protein
MAMVPLREWRTPTFTVSAADAARVPSATAAPTMRGWKKVFIE